MASKIIKVEARTCPRCKTLLEVVFDQPVIGGVNVVCGKCKGILWFSEQPFKGKEAAKCLGFKT